MERPNYRRVTESRLHIGTKHDDKDKQKTLAERMTSQFIICGVIMALILVFNLIDTSLTNDIGNRVNGVIGSQPRPDEVIQAISDASDSARSMIADTTADWTSNGFDSASDLWTFNDEEPLSDVAPDEPEPDDFRIDEDILLQIQAGSDN